MKHSFLLSIFYLTGIFLLLSGTCMAQKDTVVVKQGDRLFGEVLSLDHNVLLFKTNYSADAISLKWNEIAFMKAGAKFKVLDNNNQVFIGSLRMDTAKHSSALTIIGADTSYQLKIADIQEFSKFDKRFFDRFKISADLGVIVTRANHSDQASLDLSAKYFAQRWEFDFDYSGYASTVDTIKTNRANLELSAKYNFPQNWFLIARLNSFLSTEQRVDSRVNYLLGVGKYILRGRNINLWGYTGATYNREKFTDISQPFKSAEAFVGLHFEASPIERVSIVSDLITYPSLSDGGRLRLYSKTDAFFSFARHFRFGLGYILNTDNRPPVNASKTDFLFNAKLGWTL